MTGVLLAFAHESFTAVATDGFRLAAQTFACQTGIEEDVLVPAKGFAKAAAILGDEHPVELLHEGNRLIAFTEDALVAFQLIDQKYPDWQQIVPASFTNQTIVAHKGFEQAVKQALVISRGSDNKFAINLAAENNAVVVVGQDDAGSQSQSTLHSDIASRAFFTINGAFLLQTVTALKSAVNLKLQSNQSTKAIQITSDQEPGFMAILMPITLGESHDLARADEMRSLAKAASVAMGMAE